MREIVVIRLNDHQDLAGVHEYSLEVAVPNRFQKVITGASQLELMNELVPAFEQVFTMLEIPENIERNVAEPMLGQFTNADGTPQPISGFAATAKARFEAQVIRNGKVVED